MQQFYSQFQQSQNQKQYIQQKPQEPPPGYVHPRPFLEQHTTQQYQVPTGSSVISRPVSITASEINDKQYLAYFASATPGQFKPIKMYILFNDATSIKCIQDVRKNIHIDKRVEIIDALQINPRPSWLKGVPSLCDEHGKLFIGSECIMWIQYHSSQTIASVTESTGVSQIMNGTPAAVDGTATMTGVLGNTSEVPQQLVTDNQLLQQVGINRSQQNLENIISNRESLTIQRQTDDPFKPQQVGRNNANAERLDLLIQQVQTDRNSLLNKPHIPHHQQQRMGWNPVQTETVSRTQYDQSQLDRIEKERSSLAVPIRRL